MILSLLSAQELLVQRRLALDVQPDKLELKDRDGQLCLLPYRTPRKICASFKLVT